MTIYKNKGTITSDLFWSVSVIVLGIVSSLSILEKIELTVLFRAVLSYCILPGILFVPTLQLFNKLSDLSGSGSLSLTEHGRLRDIIKIKSRSLKGYMLYLLLSVIVFVVTAILMTIGGDYAENMFIVSTAILFLEVYLFTHILRGSSELNDFKWDIEQRALERTKREETLKKLNDE